VSHHSRSLTADGWQGEGWQCPCRGTEWSERGREATDYRFEPGDVGSGQQREVSHGGLPVAVRAVHGG